MIVLVLLSAFVNLLPSNGCTDLTRVPETYGTEVVLACVRLIQNSGVFGEDYRLLRRIALVESQDGENAFTYVTQDFHGGIWGISKEAFNLTKSAATEDLLDLIDTSFEIDWKSVEWDDLRKPLYSALAARIYLHVESNGALSDSSEQHLTLWRSLIGQRRMDTDFTTVATTNETISKFTMYTLINLLCCLPLFFFFKW